MSAPDTLPVRLPWLIRHRARIAGFVAGAALLLLLSAKVNAIFWGGLSDRIVAEPSVYILY